MRLAFIFLTILGVGSCGQKGPLYLPEDSQSETAQAQAEKVEADGEQSHDSDEDSE